LADKKPTILREVAVVNGVGRLPEAAWSSSNPISPPRT
jgi:hypothetical protein